MLKTIDIETGTSLVPLERPDGDVTRFRRAPRPDATFLAQLIATASAMPQTRMLRRATQADALGGYRSAGTRGTNVTILNGDRVSLTA